MFGYTDTYSPRRQLNLFTAAIAIILLLFCIAAPLLEPRAVSALSNLQSSNSNQADDNYTASDNPNAITAGALDLSSKTGQVMNTAGLRLLGTGVSVSKSITAFDKGIGRGTVATASFVSGGVVKSAAFTGKAIGSVYSAALHPFSQAGKLLHFGSIITPLDNTPTPTIAQLRLQQAALIEQGTVDLSVASAGAGGACDAGMGNGGYPMAWCDAPMNSIRTVSYSYEAINRECTSYAFWYFTTIEGHADFHVTGDAKYWAGTSNYPARLAPAAGAIAVETAGAYGHVAIVQSLPGQTYAGKVTPAGYVLVSEMNYDWAGHFRYSYSPVSKFSSYIYR